jgi:hypothetical protein
MVIAAFARPLVDRQVVAAGQSGGGREVVILLDRSFSMGYAERWTRALDEARKVIASLGKDDRASIVPFDLRAGVVNEATNDQAILRSAVDSIRPSDAGTRYAPALTLARRIVAGSRLPRREVVVISDFQRSGWDVTDEAVLPAGVALTPVDVSAGEPPRSASPSPRASRTWVKPRRRSRSRSRSTDARSRPAPSICPPTRARASRSIRSRFPMLPRAPW